MSVKKVAIVTGGNKGIGYAIVKGLCEKYDGDVYLTARDYKRGQDAVNKLKLLGLNPLFHLLDVTDENSINNFKKFLNDNNQGIDILINNAGVAFKNNPTEPFAIKAKEVIRVNYFATLKVCETLFPLLRKNGRVVNISSAAGHLLRLPSKQLQAKMKYPNLTVSQLSELMNKFVESAEAGKNVEDGWGSSAYSISKIGVSALTFIQQRLFDAENPNRNISVNAVHPGYVDTDMTSHKGPLTIEEGARAPLYLALQADCKGKYVWKDSKIISWTEEIVDNTN